MKFVLRIMALVAILSSASAQYVPERLWVGPTIGLSGLGTSIGFGLAGEYAIDDGWGAALDLGYSNFSIESPGVTGGSFPVTKYTFISALASATYHFSPNKKFDPWVKAGLGYFNWNVTFEQDGKEIDPFAGLAAAYTSGFGFGAQVGMRYHFSDGFAGRAALGYPFIFSVGLDLATGGKASSDRSSSSTTSTSPTDSTMASIESGKKKTRADEYSLYVGPYLMAKGSLKTNVAEGWKTGVVFNLPPDFGASILVPFGKHSNVGFGLDFGLANYGYQLRRENDQSDSATMVARYSYFNVFPHFNLGGFVIGMNFGMPNGNSTRTLLDSAASVVGTFNVQKRTGKSDTTVFSPTSPNSPSYNPAQYIASMTEVRIGGSIPVVTTDFGRLNVVFQAGYSLSGLFDDFRNYEGSYPIDPDDINLVRRTEPQESLNPNIVSLSFGLCYHFRLGF
ncbi:MAG: outer membrane beta-barrel protein [bacterium]|nr:outer membrane beta-barrel protein [bacterium]